MSKSMYKPLTNEINSWIAQLKANPSKETALNLIIKMKDRHFERMYNALSNDYKGYYDLPEWREAMQAAERTLIAICSEILLS